MDTTIITPSNITFVVGLIGIIITIYKFVYDPQAKSEKTDALIEQRMKFFIESTEKRFDGINSNFQSLLLQSNNHIHTVDTKVDKVHSNVTTLSNEITRLATIIEERIPKK